MEHTTTKKKMTDDKKNAKSPHCPVFARAMAARIVARIKTNIPARKAGAGPPLGPTLAQVF
jgi:hypothetical protein